MSVTVKLPEPQYAAIVSIVLATVWLEDASPKRRKAFRARLTRAIERHKAGERRIQFDRRPDELQAVDAEVEKAFAYIEAWMEKSAHLLGD